MAPGPPPAPTAGPARLRSHRGVARPSSGRRTRPAWASPPGSWALRVHSCFVQRLGHSEPLGGSCWGHRDSRTKPGRGPARRVLAALRGRLPPSVCAERGHGYLQLLGAWAVMEPERVTADPPSRGSPGQRSRVFSAAKFRIQSPAQPPGAGVGQASACDRRGGKGTVSLSHAEPRRAPGLGAVPGDRHTRTRQRDDVLSNSGVPPAGD